MSGDQSDIASESNASEALGEQELTTYTILWKENPSRALTRFKTIQATDLETAKEAAHFLISTEPQGIGVVIGVFEGKAF
jgi:hypothetical protein